MSPLGTMCGRVGAGIEVSILWSKPLSSRLVSPSHVSQAYSLATTGSVRLCLVSSVWMRKLRLCWPGLVVPARQLAGYLSRRELHQGRTRIRPKLSPYEA